MSIKILQSSMKKYSYLGQELDNKFDELKVYNKQKEDKQHC